MKFRYLPALLFSTMLFSASSASANPELYKTILTGKQDEAIAIIKSGAPVEPQCAMPETCAPLLAAIEMGDQKIIKHLIARGVNLNLPAGMDFLAFDIALQRFYDATDNAKRERARKVVRRMVKAGVDINRFNGYGQSGFSQAAAKGDVEMVTLMLEHGAKLDAVAKGTSNMFAATPLMMAAEKGHKDMVKLLLAKGANKKQVDELNRTAADYAKSAGHQDLVALLQ